jgi:hypothetical protein
MGKSRYGQWELYDGRLSRTVLRGALGEIPEVYSLYTNGARARLFLFVAGSIQSSGNARTAGLAGVEDRGMLPKGSPGNPGELTISSKRCALVPRMRSGTRSVGQEGRAYRSEHALIEVSRRQGQPEAAVTDSTAVLRAHITGEGGEPQGSRKGRPGYPLEGRGEQMDGAIR